jgi:hypothetical protein
MQTFPALRDKLCVQSVVVEIILYAICNESMTRWNLMRRVANIAKPYTNLLCWKQNSPHIWAVLIDRRIQNTECHCTKASALVRKTVGLGNTKTSDGNTLLTLIETPRDVRIYPDQL